MSGRFRIDPRAPAPERAPPPAVVPPKAAAPTAPAMTPLRPTPLAPKPAAGAAAPAKNRRALVLGAIVLALLLVGGGVAVFVATAQGYPDKYVLKEREYPSGMTTARLSQTERDDLGVTSNPGEVDQDKSDLADEFETNDGRQPDEAYSHVLATSSGGRILIFALQYPDEEAAKEVARDVRALCSFAGGAALRDGKVLVVIISEDGASAANVRAVRNALQEKTSDLATVC